mgnify:CR=1 FL=1
MTKPMTCPCCGQQMPGPTPSVREALRREAVLIVCRHYRVGPGVIFRQTRGLETHAWARQVVMYLLAVELQDSATDAGLFLGRDRTSVTHGAAKVGEALDAADVDPRLTAALADMRAAIGGWARPRLEVAG